METTIRAKQGLTLSGTLDSRILEYDYSDYSDFKIHGNRENMYSEIKYINCRSLYQGVGSEINYLPQKMSK